MTKQADWIIIARLAVVAAGLWGGCQRAAPTRKEGTVTSFVEIVPGRSIGQVRLGAKVSELPAGARVSRPAGEMNGVHFVVDEADRVEDIWIDDIRTFPHELRVGEKVIPRSASLDDVRALLGGCTPVEGVKGGLFFDCAAGVAIGTDFTKTTLQLRVKPRSGG